MWSTAVPDWERRLLAGESLVPDLPLFPEERDRALRIFNRLRLPDVVGQPKMEVAAGDWFRDIVAVLFGSLDPDANRRMVQELFLLVPKKNGKSSYAAAIMVVAMLVNRRPNAEFLLIAPTKEVAGIAYKQARNIIVADPELAKAFKPPQDHIKTITHRRTGATLQIKAADTDVITGSKSTGILVDETHVFAKKPNAKEIFVEIRGALAARPDGFMIQITTQSKEPPAGVFKSELSLARDIRDGLVTLPRLAVLYEIPDRMAKDGGWKNKDLWPLVNPNMGRSVDPTFLENELTAAERDGPDQLALLASQHFNVEIGQGLRANGWAGAPHWERNAVPGLDLARVLERSEVCTIGIDWGGADDLASLVVLGRDKDSKAWLCWSKSWARPSVFEQRKQIAPALRDFEAQGDLAIAETGEDQAADAADICEFVAQSGLLPEQNGIGLDAAGVALLVDALEERKLTQPQVVAVAQGWKLQTAISTLPLKLEDGRLKHGGQPIMAWAVGNAKQELRGSNYVVTKAAAGAAKIDPLMALFNAAMLMFQNPAAARGPSVYESRGLLLA
jgi:phage terminase large subunit-like protein